ncbi:kinase-like domain-containing protein [Leucosporidium creatinivorum]|uniref:non-specific serine/threonine protein kinase n=1 Tax=Leucosporidium creatinivorum TaxID=106004 RepID=A0A1Y2EY74_9BASI|nr:kinase-like domain-containing protein [Leucosporidium creatinivorum]
MTQTTASRPTRERDGSASSVTLIRKTVGDFTVGETLGEGSYSTVSLVTDKHPPHRSYALKMLDKDHIKREKKTKYVLIERDTLKTLDGHPGIVRLYWTFQDQRSLYYVLELAKNGELLKWIKKFGSFHLPSARFYAAQILSAVEHMHSKGVIHRDLKPENILLDDKMRVKITDFGTAKLQTTAAKEEEEDPSKPRSRSFVGTPEYVSPEILSEKKESSPSSDYWGFGCILFQILAGRPPFQARTEYLMFQKIINLEYEFPLGFPPDAKDLVEKLLVSSRPPLSPRRPR